MTRLVLMSLAFGPILAMSLAPVSNAQDRVVQKVSKDVAEDIKSIQERAHFRKQVQEANAAKVAAAAEATEREAERKRLEAERAPKATTIRVWPVHRNSTRDNTQWLRKLKAQRANKTRSLAAPQNMTDEVRSFEKTLERFSNVTAHLKNGSHVALPPNVEQMMENTQRMMEEVVKSETSPTPVPAAKASQNTSATTAKVLKTNEVKMAGKATSAAPTAAPKKSKKSSEKEKLAAGAKKEVKHLKQAPPHDVDRVANVLAGARFAAAKLREARLKGKASQHSDHSIKDAEMEVAEMESRLLSLRSAKRDASSAGDTKLADSLDAQIQGLEEQDKQAKANLQN